MSGRIILKEDRWKYTNNLLLGPLQNIANTARRSYRQV